MKKKVQTAELTKKKLEDLLDAEYLRWDELYRHGGSDPFWEDGCNLELVRNHIIWYKRLIEEDLQPKDFPDVYFRELPPEVPQNYMADAEGIVRDAKRNLEEVERCKDYKFLESVPLKCEMTEDIKRLLYPLRSVRTLKDAIQRNDLVWMRRYRNVEVLMHDVKENAKKISVMASEPKQLPQGQLSIFDYMGVGT